MVRYLSYTGLKMAGVVRILGVLSIFAIHVQCSYLPGSSKVLKPVATSPIVKCGPVCKMACKFGNVLDRFGCPICQCKPGPCKPVSCKMMCPSGYQRDKNGCQICKCKVESMSQCFEKKKSGPCKAAIPRYFYNKRKGRCQTFLWGGCQPSGNNFNTLAACERVCETISRCDEPLKVGPCKGSIRRFYYNKVTGMCQRFSWGGCQPNGNHFRTMKACRRVCGCNLPKKEGPCRGVYPRYFYNKKSGQCEKFNYGGCQGNGNRFKTLRRCERLCSTSKPKCGPVCRIHCPYGNVLDARGCPICKCKPAPCPEITCLKFCSDGYLKDKNGCQTCTCKPPPCPEITCLKFCPNGYLKDKNGCQTCTCKPSKPKCGPVCRIHCPYGNVLDARGCPICKCKPAPCPEITCLKFCPNGYLEDKNGCQTCTCKPSHSSSCNAPKKVGPCKARIPRYYYNRTTGKCEKFFWGGCQANSNNFATLANCKGACECLAAKKIGPCRASIPRYYYDNKSKTCKKFYWGGCNANGNNFKELSTCKRLCNVKY